MRKIFISLIGFLLLASTVYGAVAINEDGTYQGEAVTIDMPATWVTAFDGSTITIDPTPVVRFYPEDFGVMALGGTVIYDIADAAQPGYETNNGALSINWGDGNTSYAMITFRVPSDYSSGGAFRVLADQDGDPASESHCEIEFHVRSHTVDGASAWSTVDYPVDHVGARVSLDLDIHGSPTVVTLTPTGATFTAGNIVTLMLWRSNHSLSTAGSHSNATADLEVYYAEFFYSAN